MTDSPFDWFRLTFADVFGAAKALQIPASRWEQALDRGVMFDGSSLEGPARQFESDMVLRPVPETLVDLGGGIARVICEVATPTGGRWPGDPRTALRLVVEREPDLHEAWRGQWELEYYLLDRDGTPIDRAGYFDGIDGRGADISRTAADLLGEHNVPVLSSHHEAGPGQYEIDAGPLPALEFADSLVLAKQVIRQVADAQGVTAIFLPRPLEREAGSGLHLHQRADDLLTDANGRLTEIGRSYVAGQLAHGRGLCALFASTVNSYKRLHVTYEAPGAVMWSHRHRAALVRVGPMGAEFRGADPAANPYLLVAGLLLAGAAGVAADLRLGPAQDESVGGFDASRAKELYRPLPRSLDEALDALLQDDELADGLDSALLERYVDGLRVEAETYREHITGWERELGR